MCPGLDHPAFPLIPERVSHSISSWQRSPLPSALAPTHLPSASPEVCLFQPHHQHSHPGCSFSVFMPAPVCKTSHCPRPFLPSCPCHACPLEAGKQRGSLRSGSTSLFSPSPHAPWHTGRLWGSLRDPLVCVFLASPKGQKADRASDGAGKVTLRLDSTVVPG